MKQVLVNSQSGSALVYILIAIALMAALTASLLDSSSEQSQAQNSASLSSEISSQSRFIRGVIDNCYLLYPDGDADLLTGSGHAQAGEQMNHPYPIRPNHPYFAAHTDGRAADDNVANLRCPGNPGDDVDHIAMFGGTSGKFMPPPPKLMENWQYYAGADGVFYWLESDKSDPYISDAFDRTDALHSNCESDHIDATGSAVVMTSDNVYLNGTDGTEGTLSCPSGSRCFRVWVRRTGSAVPACP